jgi:uncharacterized protein YndB with AHSA1/START domain
MDTKQNNNIEGEVDDLTICIERTFYAPPAFLFQAWTQREHFIKWFGPEGFTIPFCEMNVSEGAAWRACMRSSQGIDCWVQGVYQEIAAPGRLAFTYAEEDDNGKPGHQTLVTLAFNENESGTKVIFRQAAFESIDDRDGHAEGWASAFDCLEKYLTKDFQVTKSPDKLNI